jgi:hypothetical protein
VSGFGLFSVLLAFILLPTGASAASAPTAAPAAPTGVTAVAGTLAATVSWQPSGQPAASYTVTSTPGGIAATVDGAAGSASVTGLSFGISYTFSVQGTNAVGTGPASAASNAVTPDPPGGQYHQGLPLVLFNRDVSTGQPLAVNLADDPAHLPGLLAVVLNITASQATVATSVQLVVNQQVVQTIPVAPGQVDSNLAVIAIPATLQQAAVKVTAGRAHVELDFVGYTTGPKLFKDHSGMLRTLRPAALFDAPVAANSTTKVPVLGQAGIPAANVAEVLVNVTVSNPAAAGSLALEPSALPAWLPPPANVNLGFAAGQTTANRAIVAVGSDGAIAVLDRGSAAGVRVEVMGWFTSAADPTALGAFYGAAGPARLVDTAAHGGPVAAGTAITFAVRGQGGAPDNSALAPATSAILAITAVAPAGAGAISFAGASVVDYAAGQTVSGEIISPLAGDGSVAFKVNGAATNLTVDLVGFFSGDLIVPGSTKVLAPDLLAGITRIGADNSVTFAAGTQVSPRIRLNDVIAAGISPTTPHGFLFRVLSLSTLPTGETVLGTRVARLPEAVTAFSIQWALPPKGVTTAAPRKAGAMAAPNAAPSGPTPVPTPTGTSIDPNYPSFGLSTPGTSLVLRLGAASELDINDFEIQALPQFSMDVNPFGSVVMAVGFNLGARVAVELQLLEPILRKTFTPYDHIFIIGPPQVLLIGLVPLVFQPELQLKLTLDLQLDAGLVVGFNMDRFAQVTGGYDGTNFYGGATSQDYIHPASLAASPSGVRDSPHPPARLLHRDRRHRGRGHALREVHRGSHRGPLVERDRGRVSRAHLRLEPDPDPEAGNHRQRLRPAGDSARRQAPRRDRQPEHGDREPRRDKALHSTGVEQHPRRHLVRPSGGRRRHPQQCGPGRCRLHGPRHSRHLPGGGGGRRRPDVAHRRRSDRACRSTQPAGRDPGRGRSGFGDSELGRAGR